MNNHVQHVIIPQPQCCEMMQSNCNVEDFYTLEQ